MTMTDTELVLPAPDHSDPEFLALAKNDCFLREVDEVGVWLRSPDALNEFVLTLKLLKADLESQLSNYNDTLDLGDREPDPDWRARTRRLNRAVSRRLMEVHERQRTLDRQALGNGTGELNNEFANGVAWSLVKTLRRAIHQHRDALLEQGDEPSETDLILWAALEPNEGNS